MKQNSFELFSRACNQIYLLILSCMGNQQPRKLCKATKGQIDIACLKAKFHLELTRDRKNAEIIKGEKQLVNKLRSKSRNKVQEILIAERVVTGLKYAQACNLLMSCAVSLKGHALYIADNQGNPEKMEPWLPFIYSLIYGADHLGLSSLNEFKSVMKSLNDPIAVPKYTNPEIVQLLSPSPTPQELNVYIVEMSERNQIPLEEINMVGHQFTREYVHPLSPQQIQLQRQLAQQLKGNFDQGWGPGQQHQQQGQGFDNRPHGQGGIGQGQGQGGSGGQGQGGFGGQGQGGFGGQGQGGFGGQGQGQGQGGFGGQGQGFGGQGQGGFGGQGQGQGGYNNQGGFNGGQGGFGGGNNQNPYTINNGESNIYAPKNQAPKNFNVGPSFDIRDTLKKQEPQNKPRQFDSFEDIIGLPEDPNKGSIYPSIQPTKISAVKYSPDKKGGVENPFARQSIVEVNNKGQPTASPTISQILRDFK